MQTIYNNFIISIFNRINIFSQTNNTNSSYNESNNNPYVNNLNNNTATTNNNNNNTNNTKNSFLIFENISNFFITIKNKGFSDDSDYKSDKSFSFNQSNQLVIDNSDSLNKPNNIPRRQLPIPGATTTSATTVNPTTSKRQLPSPFINSDATTSNPLNRLNLSKNNNKITTDNNNNNNNKSNQLAINNTLTPSPTTSNTNLNLLNNNNNNINSPSSPKVTSLTKSLVRTAKKSQNDLTKSTSYLNEDDLYEKNAINKKSNETPFKNETSKINNNNNNKDIFRDENSLYLTSSNTNLNNNSNNSNNNNLKTNPRLQSIRDNKSKNFNDTQELYENNHDENNLFTNNNKNKNNSRKTAVNERKFKDQNNQFISQDNEEQQQEQKEEDEDNLNQFVNNINNRQNSELDSSSLLQEDSNKRLQNNQTIKDPREVARKRWRDAYSIIKSRYSNVSRKKKIFIIYFL
jgi:hypothetical protein